MDRDDRTMAFAPVRDESCGEILLRVYDALISGDPTYITSYKNARSLICRFERDELLEEVMRYYLTHKTE